MGLRLFEVTQAMACCNWFSVKPIDEWPSLSPEFDIALLEKQACKLEGDLLERFVDGEESDVAYLTRTLGLCHLDNFLTCVFDGHLHDQVGI